MDLGRLNRNAEDRSVVWAALVTAFLGLIALVTAWVASLEGRTPDARVTLVFALVLFALAYAIHRGSRVAAVLVVTVFLANAVLTILFVGVSLATLAFHGILGAMLWAGMRGVFAQRVRAASSAGRPG
jgi:uncharacterized membrane protein